MQLTNSTIAVIQLLVLPVISKAMKFIHSKGAIKSQLIGSGVVTGLWLSSCYTTIKNQNIYQLSYMFLTNYLSLFLNIFVLELFLDWFLLKMNYYKEQYKIA